FILGHYCDSYYGAIMSSRGHSRNRYGWLQNSRFVAQLPFDLMLNEQQLFSSFDDHEFTEFMLKYHESLLPSSCEQQALTTLVNRLCEAIDSVIVNPTGTLAGQIEEVRPVGSFKLGTWLAGHDTAEVVVVTRAPPTADVIKNIKSYVEDRFASDKSEKFAVDTQFYGFSVTVGSSIARVFVSTTPANLSKNNSESFSTKPCNSEICSGCNKANTLAGRKGFSHHVMLIESAFIHIHFRVKVLIRIVKHFRRRFKGFQYLSSWMINLLAVYAVTQNITPQPLPINLAFRRFLQLLSSGMLVPGSVGLVDPCEPGALRLHSCISLSEQDELCCTAQTLLRSLIHGAHEILFTFDEYAEGASSEQFLQCVSAKCGLDIKWSEPAFIPENAQTTGVYITESAQVTAV
ncbi:interleukin enhancer-binding factor 2, partial [Paragonimus westermani]